MTPKEAVTTAHDIYARIVAEYGSISFGQFATALAKELHAAMSTPQNTGDRMPKPRNSFNSARLARTREGSVFPITDPPSAVWFYKDFDDYVKFEELNEDA